MGASEPVRSGLGQGKKVNAVGEQSLGLGTGGSQDTEVVGILSLHQGQPDCAAQLTTILPATRDQGDMRITPVTG